MGRKTKRILVSVALAVFAAFILYGIYCITVVNARYPEPAVIKYGMNEAVESRGFQIKATDFQILNNEEAHQQYPDIFTVKQEDMKRLGEPWLFFVTVEVTNVGSDEENFPLSSVQLTFFPQAYSVENIAYLNNVPKAKEATEVQKGETVTLIAQYLVHTQNMPTGSQKAEDILNREYRLLISNYPERREIQLTASNHPLR